MMQPDVFSRLLASRPSLPLMAACLLGLVCAAHLVWLISEDVLLARPISAERQAARTSSPSPAQAVSAEALIDAHFFGSHPSLQSTPQEPVPETRMALQLHGVIGSTVAEHARALIAVKGQRAKYYRVNDALPGGVSVRSIAADQVVLSRNGALETLSFPQPQPSAGHHPATDALADNSSGVPPAPSSAFQQLHESQVADHVDTQPPLTAQPSEEPSAAVSSIKERLKQLRESRGL